MFLIICFLVIVIYIFLFYNKKLPFTQTIPYVEGAACTVDKPDPNGTYQYIGNTCTLTTCKRGYSISDTSCVLIVPGMPCNRDFCPVNGNCVYDSQLICNIKINKPCIDGYGYNQGICYATGTDCLATGLYGLKPVENANYKVVPDANNYVNNCQFNCDAFYRSNITDTSCTFIKQGSCSITNPDPNAIYSYDNNALCVASSCQYGYEQKTLNGPCISIGSGVYKPIYPTDVSKLVKYPPSTDSPVFAAIGQMYL